MTGEDESRAARNEWKDCLRLMHETKHWLMRLPTAQGLSRSCQPGPHRINSSDPQRPSINFDSVPFVDQYAQARAIHCRGNSSRLGGS
jgi:hypothetical protein